MIGETPLEIAARHVRQWRERAERQEGFIAQLEAGGHDTAWARGTLALCQHMQRSAAEHLQSMAGPKPGTSRRH